MELKIMSKVWGLKWCQSLELKECQKYGTKNDVKVWG